MAVAQHWWFSGRILACHAGGPGSIPGQCNVVFSFYFIFLFKKKKEIKKVLLSVCVLEAQTKLRS